MKNVFLALTTTILCSCMNKLDGKIEIRENNTAYLVNSSKTKQFKFTVRTTRITNDSIYNYTTQIVELAPGDELFIGNKYEVSNTTYPIKVEQILVTHPADVEYLDDGRPALPGAKTSNLAKAFLNSIRSHDTIINGEKLKFKYSTMQVSDTLHPYPIMHYTYKYEVTGQLDIKAKGIIQVKN